MVNSRRESGAIFRPAPPWLAPGSAELSEVLPGFEVLELIGRGGMGAVYKARQQSLGRLVAIKILPPPPEEDPFHASARFEYEAQIMARLSHPSIVGVHDFGQTTDRCYFYFVMEFIDGKDLAQVIQGSMVLPEEKSLAMVGAVCEALAYAHSEGVVHRDIKPGNILLDASGRVKVADFGLAHVADPAGWRQTALTQDNISMGTLDYAAPELLTADIAVDQRADIYSVGVLLYQMLTGEIPRGFFKMPSEKRAGLDPRFDLIICKAMEPGIEDRYQSAQEITYALSKIQRETARPKAARPRSKRRLQWSVPVALAGFALVIGCYQAIYEVTAQSTDSVSGNTVTVIPASESIVNINLLPVNRGNVASRASLGSYNDKFEFEFGPSCATDGNVSSACRDHLPGPGHTPIHTIFHDFGSVDEGPFSTATNELVFAFYVPIHLVELAAYVTSETGTGLDESDRVVTEVGFWVDTGSGFQPAGTVTPADTDEVGGYDRVSLPGDWPGVLQVVLTFRPKGTEKWVHNEVRVAEVVLREAGK